MNAALVSVFRLINKIVGLGRKFWFWGWLGLMLCLAACDTANNPISPPTQSPIPSPSETLPPTRTAAPTWTATHTIEPSVTPTTTATATETPSITPTATLQLEQICETFSVTSSPREEIEIAYQGALGFSWEYAPWDSAVVLSFIHQGSGQETLDSFPPDYGFNLRYEVGSLPAWGAYKWTLSLYIEAYGELCPVSGTFYRRPWWADPISNPANPPFNSLSN